jgi:hypothetical protein
VVVLGCLVIETNPASRRARFGSCASGRVVSTVTIARSTLAQVGGDADDRLLTVTRAARPEIGHHVDGGLAGDGARRDDQDSVS